MTKDHWMYLSIALVVVGAYLYMDETKILKACAAAGVTGVDPSVQKRIDKYKK